MTHMQTATEIALEKAERGVFTRDQAALWVRDRGARLDALLKRAVASREVRRVRRGLYCLSEKYSQGRVDPLELAQRIHGPSYISLETALSHHGWIPEAVRAVTSAALGRSRTFDTPVGLFSFTRVPQRAGPRSRKSRPCVRSPRRSSSPAWDEPTSSAGLDSRAARACVSSTA